MKSEPQLTFSVLLGLDIEAVIMLYNKQLIIGVMRR